MLLAARCQQLLLLKEWTLHSSAVGAARQS
jgi:hypothetical protein